MYFRCQILINGISYEATDDLKNWDDFELAYKRSNYDGVLRSFSTKFELVNRSYSLLKEEFEQHYLSAKAAIAFYLRNNSWNWDKVFQCALDFSTYSDDGYVISINAIDNTLAAIINAKKSIQYEYLVADLETRNLKYDRIDMINSVNWYVTGENVEGSADVKNQFAGATYNAIPLYYSEEEIFRNTITKENAEVLDDGTGAGFFPVILSRLGYTTFALNAKEIFTDGETISVKTAVKNTGAHPGKEVVQLYIAAPGKTMVKPQKELKAFAKTKILAPGESEVVRLVVGLSELASFDEQASCWAVESGRYLAIWGSSSRDCRLKQSFTLRQAVTGEEVHRVLLPVRQLEELY